MFGRPSLCSSQPGAGRVDSRWSGQEQPVKIVERVESDRVRGEGSPRCRYLELVE
jgi:hypothetical protein